MAIKDAFIAELKHESSFTKKCWKKFHWIKKNGNLMKKNP